MKYKFKVGDRVKNIGRESYYGICLGDIGIVTEESLSPFVKWDKNKKLVAFNEKELELVYTYEDLKKSPIGTKITFENGAVLVKDEEDSFENISRSRNITHLCNLKDKYNSLGEIIKIEEPEYKTVYESKVEILDEAEKRYLKGVIRPFRDKVKSIEKVTRSYDNEHESFINIDIDNDENIMLPYFYTDTMYKGMKLGEKYTLEELGL